MTRPPLTSEILDTDTRRWRLSLQVCPEAIEAVLRPVSPGGTDKSMIWSRIPLPESAASEAGAVQEAVYANPLLVAPFGKVDVLVRTPRAAFIPAGDSDAAVPVADLLGWEAPADTLFTSGADRLYSVVAAADTAVLRFLRRTFDTAEPRHPLAVLARWFGSRSLLGNSGKVFVNLNPGRADVFVYNNLGLAAATTLPGTSPDELCYYVLALARNCGLSPDDYEIHLAGDPAARTAAAGALRRFVPVVVPAVFPAAMLAYGQKALAAPLELTILPLCE